MAAKFPNADLVACALREVAMREKSYPKWEGKTSIAECSQKHQQEYAMMQAIAEQLQALPELLKRYGDAKDVLRTVLPQPVTFDFPVEGTLVLVYCANSDRPWFARRIGLNKWLFESNNGDIMENGLDSEQVIAYSYPPALPSNC